MKRKEERKLIKKILLMDINLKHILFTQSYRPSFLYLFFRICNTLKINIFKKEYAQDIRKIIKICDELYEISDVPYCNKYDFNQMIKRNKILNDEILHTKIIKKWWKTKECQHLLEEQMFKLML